MSRYAKVTGYLTANMWYPSSPKPAMTASAYVAGFTLYASPAPSVTPKQWETLLVEVATVAKVDLVGVAAEAATAAGELLEAEAAPVYVPAFTAGWLAPRRKPTVVRPVVVPDHVPATWSAAQLVPV